MEKRRFDKSQALFKRAQKAIPSQTQTFSKGWTQYPFGAAPIFANRADGGYVWDVDGNRFIDWPMALGPLLLGHNHPAVGEALRKQLSSGIAFSLPTGEELRLAERLIEWFPFAERVRFGKNGSDATTGAVRVARAFTGKERILCCGYHGWHDWFVGTTTRNAGVPKAVRSLTTPFAYNDAEALRALLERFSGEVAAIIMEPMGIVQPEPGYLEAVRDLATRHAAVLIFDECWTGFRVHTQGAYGAFGVAPDLACFGKAMGNGVPVSAIVGRAEIMDTLDEVFFSFTFGGDMLGIAAAHAVLDVFKKQPVLAHVAAIGQQLMDGITELVKEANLDEFIGLAGYPARHFLTFKRGGEDDLMLKSIFQQQAIQGGILAAGWHAPSLAHTAADVEETLAVYRTVFSDMVRWIAEDSIAAYLHGEPVRAVFRKP